MSRRSADQFHLREESPLTCLVDENCIKIDARLRCNQSQVPLVASVASQGVPGECVCLSGLDWNAETNSCQSSRFWFNMGLLVMGVILLLMLFGLIAYFVLRVHE
ncbi:hypothetical protein TCAL_08677 [Tigriopus californicus]|uniref:Uncharacterized protein n=1 Tax=Tigriopus californicus TaxID=6832 RepID=A0A553PDG2_TIGCA|nr:hypothetical protein TCAL_08677 [Tigriopus californicus]